MKSLVVGLFTVLAVCSLGFSDIVRQYKTTDPGGKDAGIRLTNHGNKGGNARFRFCKPWGQGLGIFDFGDEVAMNTQLLADLALEGFASINAALVPDGDHPAGHIVVQLAVVPSGDWVNPANLKQIQVAAFKSQTAWAEGNGNDADSDWSSTILAATGYKAQDVQDGVGAVAWQLVAGTDLASFGGLNPTYQAAQTPNFQIGIYSYIPLDMLVWRNYIGATVAGPGLVTKEATSGGSGDPNLSCYSRQQNSSVAPMLQVSVVPEPATMAVLLVGGVAALIRRRR